jgi:hypothetical protein
MDALQSAVEFLLVGDRAQALAKAHTLSTDGRCGLCNQSNCTAARLASEALAVLAARGRDHRDPGPMRFPLKRSLGGPR